MDDAKNTAELTGGINKVRREIMEGLPVSVLASMFHTSIAVVRKKLASVKPVGERYGDPIYNIAEAAQFLVKPQIDLAAYIKTLRPNDVPVPLQKQFWDAMLGRQKFEEQAGNLWSTAKVQHAVGELLRIVRQRTQLLADTVERQVGLSDAQRNLILGISDSMLDDLHNKMIEHFKDYKLAGERDDVYENGPPTGSVNPDGEEDEFGGL